MDRQTVEFITVVKNDTVCFISRTTILQPQVRFKGGTVPWFDDSQLIKKGEKPHDKSR